MLAFKQPERVRVACCASALVGDLNRDGAVDRADQLILYRIIAGRESPTEWSSR